MEGSSVKRRDLLNKIALGAATLSLSRPLLAKGEAPVAASASPLLDAILACQKEALRCQAHCLKLFEAKDTMMASCYSKLTDLLALNEAGLTLFARDSELGKDFAAVLKKSADTCAAECGKHASHHEVCASCEKACIALSKAITTRFAA